MIRPAAEQAALAACPARCQRESKAIPQGNPRQLTTTKTGTPEEDAALDVVASCRPYAAVCGPNVGH
jgi:hypothetical protein